MSARRLLAPLTLPFAAVGFAGGAFVGHIAGPRPFELSTGWLAVALSTALLCARLGQRLSRSDGAPPQATSWWPRVIGRALLAGGLNGVLLFGLLCFEQLLRSVPTGDALVLAVFPGSLMAWLLGVAFSLAFIPSLLVVAGASWRAEQARAGSLARRLLERRVWLATAALVAVHSVVVLEWTRAHHLQWLSEEYGTESTRVLQWLLGAAVIASVVLVPLESVARGSLALVLRVAGALPKREPEARSLALETDPDFRDLGVGDDELLAADPRRAPDHSPYRATAVATLRFLGDPSSTRQLVDGAGRWLLVAALLSVIPVALLLRG